MTPLTLFVKPFVRKFIRKNYGKEPVYVRADSDLGRLFCLALSKDNLLPIDELEIEEDIIQKKDKSLVKMKFVLSFRVAHGKLTLTNYHRLCGVLEQEFEKGLYFFSLGMRRMNASERNAVKMFLDYYDINDDDGITPAGAVKIAQRSRTQKETQAAIYQ